MTNHEELIKAIKASVKEVVDSSLGGHDKAELEKIQALIDNAETTVTELADIVQAKDEELTTATEETRSLKEQVEQLVVKTRQLEEQLAARDAETVELEKRAMAAETVLADIESSKMLAGRMAELAEAKVAKVDPAKLEAQANKVKMMTDEEYSAYKEELIDLRSAFEEAIKAQASALAVSEEAAAADKTEPGEPATVDVAPPDLTNKDVASAAVDVELKPMPNNKEHYHRVGQGLAKIISRKDKK